VLWVLARATLSPPSYSLTPTRGHRYGSGGFAITSLITAVSSQFMSQQYLDATTSFWSAHNTGGAELEVLRSQESVGARMLWNQNQLEGTCTWLGQQ